LAPSLEIMVTICYFFWCRYWMNFQPFNTKCSVLFCSSLSIFLLHNTIVIKKLIKNLKADRILFSMYLVNFILKKMCKLILLNTVEEH